MFVNHRLDDIKAGKATVEEPARETDLAFIIAFFENENIAISDWQLFEAAETEDHRVYGFQTNEKDVYMKVFDDAKVVPCYFKNHGACDYQLFAAGSIVEAIERYEKMYQPSC